MLAGGLFLALFLLAFRGPADESETSFFWPVLVNVFETAGPSDAGPSGLAHRPGSQRLISSSSAPDAIGSPGGVVIRQMNLEGILLELGTTEPFGDLGGGRPTGVAYNPSDGHYFFTSSDPGSVAEVDPGSDGRLGTSDDTARSFATAALGSGEPAGIAFDTRLGHLFIADRASDTVLEILPGANGIFDGAPPQGDDEALSFDTLTLGITAPEAVEYNSDDDTVFIVGEDGGVEATRDGLLVRHLVLDPLGLLSPTGAAYAPSSRDPEVGHLYIVDRSVEPQNAARIYEVTLAAEPGFVSAQIATGSDDAEEDSSGRVDRSSPALEMVQASDRQTVGLRFLDAELPPGASILEAYIQFTSAAVSSFSSRLRIDGHAVGDSSSFRSRQGDLSSRARTTAFVDWSPPAWGARAMGHEQRTPDLSAVLQEIVDQPTWAHGSALTLLVTGAGQRIATSYEGDPALAARLFVRFAPPGCGDAVKQPGELCDGEDLGSFSCEALGCESGTLNCTSECSLDLSACVGCTACGNGVLELGEECDDGNAATEDCLYGESACFACDSGCRLVSGATSFCGDGFVDPAYGEECDEAALNGTGSCLDNCTSALDTVSPASSVTCGDSVVDTENGEECDDGNADNTDACLDSCELASCGDGFTRAGHEACDDGNADNTDACLNSCEAATCGDGFTQAGVETCDDGNAINTDACLNSCEAATCGDGFTQAGVETCDDGNAVNTDACLNSCEVASCGDGFTQAGVEICDDGNGSNADGCLNSCEAASCGDGFTQTGVETCDDGNGSNTDACLNSCEVASCGDGFTQSGVEICDDGNGNNTDACLNSCEAATCGDGFTQAGVETCDDGNAINTDACLNSCEAATCGDGFTQTGVETCDDGNGSNTDACLNSCEVASCGDGFTQSGVEICDDGNGNNTDACLNSCEAATCGDGFTQAGVETCDDGNSATEVCDYGETSCLVCDSSCQELDGATSFCGDGSVDALQGEQCDDGNGDDGDACLSDCVVAACGDGFVHVGVEACDDGNTLNSDGCLNGCIVASCGDGFTQAGVEQCDDGNASNGDSCLNSCAVASCGDGFTQNGVEQCDDGNSSNSDSCLNSCTPASCGDGLTQAGVEQCDDGNASNADSCLNSCAAAACGDGFTWSGVEQCDDGNASDSDSCLNSCTAASCGDGVTQGGVEQCDDGNGSNGDSCLNSCAAASCGDGFTWSGVEECDDANGSNGDSCLNSCTLASCGDGFTRSGVEQCDDGNGSNADACLNSCASASCGDGFTRAGVEQCDDGNGSNGDGCLNSCTSASCGDGFTRAGVEQCDDANVSNADACLNSCTTASCGDSFTWSGVEQCDDGNASNRDACLNTCVSASCGDGFARSGVEQCDDGNASNADACLNSCVNASCGDGFTRTGVEQCDDANGSNTDGCLNGCLLASCGDGFRRSGVEQCDDGNAITEVCSYGLTVCVVCDASCDVSAGATSYCGDGAVDPLHGEGCDDGNTILESCSYGETSCAVCDPGCSSVPGETSFCGDGALDPSNGEYCDDGNTRNDDACLDVCALRMVPKLANLLDVSSITPPSPDTAGLAYRADSRHLLMCDSEVNETALFEGVNVWETTLRGGVVDTGSTSAFNEPGREEPTGIAYNPGNGHYFVSSDAVRAVREVDLGPDGRLGTADDTVTSFATDDFGSEDPEGIAFDPSRGHLFVADGVGAWIYRVRAGPNGIFDGVPPEGDDQVDGFGTESLGVTDPEGVEYNPDGDTLFIVGNGDDRILETTLEGELIRQLDVSGLRATSLAGVAYGPASDDPDVRHLYLADRGTDNNVSRGENDGRVYEITLADEPGLLNLQIESGPDDAEETVSGDVSLKSRTLEMGVEDGPRIVGLRFTGATIPRGAPIVEARLQFTADEEISITSSLRIQGQATGDAERFRDDDGDLSSRSRTLAWVDWSLPAWTAEGASGPAQRTPDLSAIVQEIVDRSSWASGNALVFLVTGEGLRGAAAHDRSGRSAASLRVRFAPSTCGNGVKQLGELCDGGDLGSFSCSLLGCSGGTLACSNTCSIDAMGCVGCPECGNGVVEVDEQCDDGNAITDSCSYGELGCTSCDATCRQVDGATSFCGDGFVDPAHAEECDDADLDDLDDCPGTCRVASCGDGFLQLGVEQCDDANRITEDCLYGETSCVVCDAGCQTTAGTTSFCGDGVHDPLNGEQCDDANLDNTDGCLDSCLVASCGDGFVQTGVEACDDANGNNGDACLDSCEAASCGDGFRWAGVEPCDDGNLDETDSCISSCLPASCGDGFLRTGIEGCDDGNTSTEACNYGLSSCEVCDAQCQAVPGATSFCGDGGVDGARGEACDDGNGDNGDACLDTCLAASCGDGFVQRGIEPCDDGNSTDTDACLGSCVVASCGDGLVHAGVEGCDDGNTDTEACGYGATTCVVCDAGCQEAAGATSYCGDGRLDAMEGEGCDDGNTSTEACAYGEESCVVCAAGCEVVQGDTALCGDGVVDAVHGEGCDDGNTLTEACEYGETGCLVCDASCDGVSGATSFCGDGVVDPTNGEACDDGNDDDGDACLSTCQAASCGDGFVQDGAEECDDGNADNTDGCLDSCSSARCGDGFVWREGEQCDDGNVSNEDGCLDTCVEAFCGDGWVHAGVEQCDDSNSRTEACSYGETECLVCAAGCQQLAGATSFCGDGSVDAAFGEGCDDGNASTEACAYGETSCVVCDASCVEASGSTSYCGDGVADPANGESCDDGNDSDADACLSLCTAASCGDGLLHAGVEGCDDGNTVTEACEAGQASCMVCDETCEEILVPEPRRDLLIAVALMTLGGLVRARGIGAGLSGDREARPS